MLKWLIKALLLFPVTSASPLFVLYRKLEISSMEDLIQIQTVNHFPAKVPFTCYSWLPPEIYKIPLTFFVIDLKLDS